VSTGGVRSRFSRYEPCNPSFRHDFVVMLGREVVVSAKQVEIAEPRDQREHAAIVSNLEMLERQQRRLGEHLTEANRGGLASRD
jgi:hypothetical protein